MSDDEPSPHTTSPVVEVDRRPDLPRRPPLSAVRLSGLRLALLRGVLILIAILSLVACVTYFLPWHEVDEGYRGGGMDFRGVTCAMTPDCDPSGFRDLEPGPPPFQDAEQVRRHNGYHHSGLLPLALLLGFALLAGLAAAEPTWRMAMVTTLTTLGAFLLLLFLLFDLDHLFEPVRRLPAAHGFDLALFGLFGLTLADLLLVPILYLGARRALPAGYVFPRARVVSR